MILYGCPYVRMSRRIVNVRISPGGLEVFDAQHGTRINHNVRTAITMTLPVGCTAHIPADCWCVVMSFVPDADGSIAVRRVSRTLREQWEYQSRRVAPMVYHWVRWHDDVCKADNVAAAQWCRNVTGMPLLFDPNWAALHKSTQRAWLRRACGDGDLDMAQWLHVKFGMTADDVRNDCNFALRHACCNGHLAVAHWLYTTFGLTADDARAMSNFAMRRACHGGHLAVVQWMHAVFNLTLDDVRTYDVDMFVFACKQGHLTIVQWLFITFGLSIDDARGNKNRALRGACQYGHIEVVRWLCTAFNLTVEDARTANNYALCEACSNGHIGVAQWLHATFGLTAYDARADDNHALCYAYKN